MLLALTLAAALTGCGGDSQPAAAPTPKAPTPPPKKKEVVEDEGPPPPSNVLKWSVGTTEWFLPVQDGTARLIGVTHVEKRGDAYVESRVMFTDSQQGASDRLDTTTSGIATWLPGLLPRDPSMGPRLNRVTVRRYQACAASGRDMCSAHDYESTAAFRTNLFTDLSARTGISRADLAAHATYAWSDPFTPQGEDAIPRSCGFGDQDPCPQEWTDKPGNLGFSAGGIEAGWQHISVDPAVEGLTDSTRTIRMVMLDIEQRRLNDDIEAVVPNLPMNFAVWAGDRFNLCADANAECTYAVEKLHFGSAWPGAGGAAADAAAPAGGDAPAPEGDAPAGDAAPEGAAAPAEGDAAPAEGAAG